MPSKSWNFSAEFHRLEFAGIFRSTPVPGDYAGFDRSRMQALREALSRVQSRKGEFASMPDQIGSNEPPEQLPLPLPPPKAARHRWRRWLFSLFADPIN